MSSIKVKKGDIKRIPRKGGDDFIVEVLDVFDYEGEQYAEVKPYDFEGVAREVPTFMLFNL